MLKGPQFETTAGGGTPESAVLTAEHFVGVDTADTSPIIRREIGEHACSSDHYFIEDGVQYHVVTRNGRLSIRKVY